VTIAVDMTSGRREAAPSIVWSLMVLLWVEPLAAGLQLVAPDPGGPSAIEQALMEHACPVTMMRAAETVEHQECLSARLLSLRADFGRDLSQLSVSERRTLDSVCSKIRDVRGREAYLECLSSQLLILHKRRSPASPVPLEAAAPPTPVVNVPSASLPELPRPVRSWLSAVWIGAAFLTVLVVAGGVLLAVRTRRPPRICRVCGGDAPESGDLCQKCRHEAAEAARHAATERADQHRALQEEVRRQSERAEEPRRQKKLEEEEAPPRQQEEAPASLQSLAVMASEELFDPYIVLGVPREASKDDIRAAYQEARSKYDPDQVIHLSAEVQQHYKEKAQAVDLAYQKLTE
jgi:DnaJ-domain-containing protein 1